MKVKVEIPNKRGICNRICKNPKVLSFLANTWKREMTPYVPFLHGPLSQTPVVEPGKVTYIQPYARHQYIGISKMGGPIVHNKEKHPKATSLWNKAAELDKKAKVAHEVTAYIRTL